MVQKYSPRRVRSRVNEVKALELRIQGFTFEDIATEVGYTHRTTARRAVIRALQRLGPPPEAEELRCLQYERLTTLLRAVWPHATDKIPNSKDQTRALEIIKEINSLLALYLPKQERLDVQVTRQHPLEDLDIAELHRIYTEIEGLEALTEQDQAYLQSLQRRLNNDSGPEVAGGSEGAGG